MKAWDDLYATWNMDFVCNHPNWPVILPKLLIPSVNDYKAEPETYINRRALALQALLYLHTLSRMDGEGPTMDWRDPAMSNLWGKINLGSARDYARQAA